MGKLSLVQYTGGRSHFMQASITVQNSADGRQTHPLRAAARFMQQKTNHHLEFLVDKIPERSDRAPVARVISRTSFNTQSPSISGPIITSIPASPSPADKGEGDDDAAGESDDGAEGSATRKAKTSSAGESLRCRIKHG